MGKTRRLPQCRASWFVVLLLVGGAAGELGAQQIRGFRSARAPEVFIPAPRELRRELEQAEADIAAERYVDAITRLDLILGGGKDKDDELTEDYFVPVPDGSLQSLRARALAIIANLPAAGREAYELQLGTDAQVALEAAIERRDWDALVPVSRRFAGTRAGQDAAMLLGRDRLQRGRPLEALLQFRRLHRSAGARERFGGELSVLLAVALASSSQDPSVALETLSGEELQALSIGGKPLAALPDAEARAQWLTRHTGALQTAVAPPGSEWRTFGGNPTRTAVRDVDMPLSRLRWSVDFTYRNDDEDLIHQQAKALGNRTALPALHPLVTDGWVLMRSTDQLWGVELESGKRIWEYPWSPDQDNGSAVLADHYGNNGSRRAQLLRTRVWEDALYGQLSSDGDAVYLLSRLGNASYNRTMSGNQPSNELVALGLAREGYSRWVVGGDDGRYEKRLAGAFFLGPPLPLDGRLYCLVELNSEVRLVVLESQTGRLLWSQQLAQAEVGRMSPIAGPRRKAGVTSSHAEGILICPTSVGGVVAVDVASRSLLWGYKYKTRSRTSIYGSQATDHWRHNWSTLAEGKVILTPFDSQELHCLDMLTGKTVWNAQPRGAHLYVAGVHEGKVILVGSDRVTALSLTGGELVWKLPLATPPAGRGTQSAGHYFLATAKPALLKIDLTTGTLSEAMDTEKPLGNLVAHGDQIIAQNPTEVRAFYQRDKLAAKVKRLLAADPDSAWALEHQALLHLDAGDQQRGLASLREAIAAYGEARPEEALAAKEVMLSTSLELLRDRGQDVTDLIADISPLIEEFPGRREEYLRVVTENLQRAGRTLEAFAKNLELFLSSRESVHQLLGSTGELTSVSKHRKVRQDRWHRALFASLWESAAEAERASMRTAIAAELAQAEPAEMPRIVEAFQDTELVWAAQLALLEDAVEARRATPDIESGLMRLARLDRPELAGPARALLAEFYLNVQRYAAAAQQSGLLEEEFADTPVRDGLTGKQWAETLTKRDVKLISHRGPRPDWPAGRVRVTLDTTAPPPTSLSTQRVSPYDALARVHRLRTLEPQQGGLTGLELVFDELGHALQGRDGVGNVLQLASLGAVLPGARRGEMDLRAQGHLLIATRGGSMVAINALRGGPGTQDALLWNEQVPAAGNLGSGNGAPVYFGETGLTRTVGSTKRKVISLGPVSDRGVVFRRYGDLICIDPRDGEIVWRRDDDVEMGDEVWGDDELVFVHSPGASPGMDSNARVFSVLDGRELESRPVPDQKARIRMFGRYVLSWTYDVLGDLTDDPDAILEEILKSENDIGNLRAEKPPENVQRVLVHRIQLNDLTKRTASHEWSHTFEFAAKACYVDEDKLAVLEPIKGHFTIFSMVTGEKLVDQPVVHKLKRVDRIFVERRAGRYLLRISEDTNGRVDGKVRYQQPNHATKLQHMEVHAFSEAGEPIWEGPARLEHFMPADFVGQDLPILVFLRIEDAAPKRKLRTLVLDVRDGSEIDLGTNLQKFEGATFHVRGNRSLKQIQLRTPGDQAAWKLLFTDEAKDSQAPYDGRAEEEPQQGSLIGSLFKAIRGERKTPPPKEDK